jgi:8-oxo-dGTP pyrophosphatase MutT (NUDIX family)
MDDGPLPWKRLGSEPGPDLHLFRTRWDRLVNPRTGEALRRLVLETPDWVNVVALTPARELVVVRQFRFGTGQVSLEIPGGIVDAGEGHEGAARRELREESGYEAERWSYLGCCEPNPAFHDNLCHHWLAEGARRVGEPRPDAGEDLRAGTIPLAAVPEAVADGRIRHSLVLVALARVLDRPLPRSAPPRSLP